MSQRFFVASPIDGAASVQLIGQEAQHLGRVMRAKPGDEVIVFDGCGAEFRAEVLALGRREVELAIVERIEVDRELPRSLTLAVAMPKGDRQKWLIEKAVELGVARVVPLTTQRGVAQPTPSTIQRLQRSVVEASKQCGRNRLLCINGPATLSDVIETAASEKASGWLAHPGAAAHQADHDASPCWIAIGPEGGFTDQEVASAAEADWTIVGLGPRILRVETAAVLLTCLLGNR